MTDVLLVLSTAGAFVAALFAILCFFRLKQAALADTLTKAAATQILRAETEITRRAGEDQARGLRQELRDSLKNFQQMTLTAFNTLRDGIDDQVRAFGERLDGGVKGIDQRAAAIADKLNADLTTMRVEAGTNREGCAKSSSASSTSRWQSKQRSPKICARNWAPISSGSAP